MSDTTHFLIAHGLPIIFAVVLLNQMGVPIPAVPWLLAAGALTADGKFNWVMGLGLSIVACLTGDFFWFYLGRYRGTQVLGFLCRLSLEPDSCVRRTVNVFTKYGWRGIIVAKFLPGMSTVTPPLAGMSQMPASRFLMIDGLASLLYSGGFLLVGFLFSHQIIQIGSAIAQIGGDAALLLGICIIIYLAYKFWQRQRLLKELNIAKISVDELGKMLDAGQNPLILDIRSVIELEQSPDIIRGAVHVDMANLDKEDHHEISRDREIVVYCDCPNEESSSKMALMLRKKGFTRVRPLLGGIEAWRKGKHLTTVWTKKTTTSKETVMVSQSPSAADGAKKAAQKGPASKL